MEERNIFNDVGAFEQRLGLPSGFYVKLLKEDDWSFVMKLNALFEAACTHALIARLHAPEIESALANLELADSARGKVKFLSAPGCITPEQSTFLRKLAELRNGLVHNVARERWSHHGPSVCYPSAPRKVSPIRPGRTPLPSIKSFDADTRRHCDASCANVPIGWTRQRAR